MKGTISTFFLSLLVVILPACSELAGGTGDDVVLGLAGPFNTGYGESMRLGAELARAEINRAGGIDGRQLRFRTESDDANSQQAISVAETLWADPEVIAVVGHLNSGAMIAASPIYNQGLPALGTGTTAPTIGRLGPWIFRVASSDSANAVVLARAARELGTSEAGVLYQNNAYGRGLAENFRSAFLEMGGRIAGYHPFLDDTDDLSPYLEHLQQRGTEMVFVASTEEGAARSISRSRELGYDARFIGGDGMEPLAGMGEAFDEHYVGLLYHPEASAGARAFAERYRATHGGTPDSYAALAYDAVHLLARAAERGGRSRDGIRDHLSTVGRTGGSAAFEGVGGAIRFDRHGDPADKPFAIGVIRNGAIDLVPEVR